MAALLPGVDLRSGLFGRIDQERLLAALEAVIAQAPFFQPRMPRSGRPFSVLMTNCGAMGWVSDVAGYRYQPRHPGTGAPWPPIPAALLDLWRTMTGLPVDPEACLLNHYGPEARMGLHQDKDERALDAPVVSLSLGDSCLFRIGGSQRSDKTISFRLHSGDALAFGGPARLAFHGVDRIYGGSSTLLPEGGRLNVTLRRIAPIVPSSQKRNGSIACGA